MDRIDRIFLCVLIAVVLLVMAACVYLANGIDEILEAVLEHFGISL